MSILNGAPVYVSDISEEHALEVRSARRYVGEMKDGTHLVERDDGQTYEYRYAAKAPAYKPFTLDTLPKQHIMVREKGGNHWRDISARSTTGVLVGTVWYEYKDLLEGREMSLSFGDTWQPAGELV